MSDQVINANHIGKDQPTFSKDKICEICDISVNTLKNWLGDEKPQENDYIIGRQQKKFYYLGYIKRVFEQGKRSDLIEKMEQFIEVGQKDTNGQPKHTNSVPYPDLEVLLGQQAKTLQILQDQLESKDKQLIAKDEQILALTEALENAQKITSQQQSLSMQQSQILLESQKKRPWLQFNLPWG